MPCPSTVTILSAPTQRRSGTVSSPSKMCFQRHTLIHIHVSSTLTARKRIWGGGEDAKWLDRWWRRACRGNIDPATAHSQTQLCLGVCMAKPYICFTFSLCFFKYKYLPKLPVNSVSSAKEIFEKSVVRNSHSQTS